MRIWQFLLAAIVTALVPVAARAQFYVLGDNPASVKWYSTETAHYRIVYPAGLDSLAMAYGRTLEEYRVSVGNSLGHAPGEWTRKKVPVIMHGFDAISNGSVAWAPARVDLFTSPEAYSPEPMPWIENLTIHEQRHVAQMQVGLAPKTFRTLGYIFGEMLDGAVAGIYLTGYIEGDAVVAETAFSRSGRGRTADFLNYYMIAFDNGDMRSMQRWRLGSQTGHYLDKYAYGYFFLSGMRWLYDNPTFLGDYYEHMERRPYDIGGFGRVLRPQTGGLGEKRVFNAVADTMRRMWGEEIAARAPYTPYSPVTEHERRYVEYSGVVCAGDDGSAGGRSAGNSLYAVRSGIARPAALTLIDSAGHTRTLRSFASVSSKLASAPSSGRLYWSEYRYDARWGMRVNSVIRTYDPSRGGRKVKSLTHEGRLFSPAVSDDGSLLSVTRYFDDGRSGLVILDAATGRQVAVLAAPDSLQIVQSAWLGDRICVSALSSCGAGLYSVGISASAAGLGAHDPGAMGSDSDGAFGFTGPWRLEMEPQPAKIDGLRAFRGSLYFSSDRLGVKELYRFDPEPDLSSDRFGGRDGKTGGRFHGDIESGPDERTAGRLFRLTSSKYGADDYSFNAAGDTLYYSLKEYDGQNVVATPSDSLFFVPTRPDSLYQWKIADNLSRQEAELAARRASLNNPPAEEPEEHFTTVGSAMEPADVLTADPDTVRLSDPKRYRKGGHLFRIHSWAPVYFNVDNIMNMSYDNYYSLASLGIAAISQNDLGTAITQFGYSAHQDPYDWSHWKHSGHLSFTYTGWYPVIEASVDFNDRNALDYSYITTTSDGSNILSASSSRSRGAGKPFVTGYVSVYIPFNFTLGGWTSGFIPQLTYSISNDSLTKTSYVRNYGSPLKDGFEFTRDGVVLLQRLTASARGYTMRPAADSGVYPRWGIGAQIGASLRPGLTDYYSPTGFLYVYGYTPGISLTQGLNLSYTLQTKFSRSAILGDGIVSTLPRGLSSNAWLSDYAAWYADSSMKFSADYAIPISTGDVSLATYLLYFSRLILTPHFDYTILNWSAGSPFSGDLWSAGASLTIDFRSFFWIKYPFQFGLTCSYNGGSAFSCVNSVFSDIGLSPLSRFYVGPVFSLSFN